MGEQQWLRQRTHDCKVMGSNPDPTVETIFHAPFIWINSMKLKEIIECCNRRWVICLKVICSKKLLNTKILTARHQVWNTYGSLVRFGQVIGYIRLGQVRLGQVRLGYRSCQVRLGQVRLGFKVFLCVEQLCRAVVSSSCVEQLTF